MFANPFTKFNKHHNNASSGLIAASFAALLLPAAANASEDTTIMPGSACKLASAQGVDTATQSFGGTIQNTGAGIIHVTCPIARAVADSESLEYAEILTSGRVSCGLFIISTTGEFDREESTGTTLVGDKTLLQWALGDPNIPVFTPSAYAFQCVMDGPSTIFYYRIDENDGEG